MKKIIMLVIGVLIMGLAMTGFAIEGRPAREQRFELLKALEETNSFIDEDGDIYSFYLMAADSDDPDDRGYMDSWFNVDLNIGHVACYGTAVEIWRDAKTDEIILRAERPINEEYDIRYDFTTHEWEIFNYGPYTKE